LFNRLCKYKDNNPHRKGGWRNFTQVLKEGALPMKNFWWTDGKILKGGAKKSIFNGRDIRQEAMCYSKMPKWWTMDNGQLNMKGYIIYCSIANM